MKIMLIGSLVMLSWAITFLILALIARLLGFDSVSAGSVGIAKLLFVIFLPLLSIGLLTRTFRRNDIRP